jgi:hypothetical protein
LQDVRERLEIVYDILDAATQEPEPIFSGTTPPIPPEVP